MRMARAVRISAATMASRVLGLVRDQLGLMREDGVFITLEDE